MSPTIESTTLPSGSSYTTISPSSTTFSSSSTTFPSSSIAPPPSIALLDCSEVENHYHGCLNGGVCKAIEINSESRSSFCVCADDFSGLRCRFLADFDSSLDMAKAGNVAIGVAVGALILIILAVGILIALRLRRRPKVRAADLTRMTSYDNRGVTAEVEPLHEDVTTLVPRPAMFTTARVPTPLVDDVSHFRFPETRPQPSRQRLDGVVERV